MELCDRPALGLNSLLKKGEITFFDITESILKRIESVEQKTNAYITLLEEKIFKKAEELDKKVNRKTEFPVLTGIPIAVKDNICTKGIRTTCASKALKDFILPYDATVIKYLKATGAVITGKTNMDEFAMGSSNENSYYGPVLNPWNSEYVPGGSVRQPASFCGVVGLKPTYGRVSRYGLVAFASSLDQIGILTEDTKDAALLLNIIGRHDRFDSTSVEMDTIDYISELNGDIRGINLGVPEEYFKSGIDTEVETRVRAAIEKFENLGAKIVEVNLPHTEYGVAIYQLISASEASSNLARYDGVRYGGRVGDYENLSDMYRYTRSDGFGMEVKRRIMFGTYALSRGYYDEYYLRAQKVRNLIKRDFDEVFKSVSAVVTPTSPVLPFKLGEKIEDPLSMYLADIYTVSVNLAGIPAISIPCGFSSNAQHPITGLSYDPYGRSADNLPVGLQIIGKPFDEFTVLRVAYAYESNTEWHTKRPQETVQ